jgi:hypothetical protein
LFHKPQPLANLIHYRNQILEIENVDDLTIVCLVTIIIAIGDNLTER